MKNLLKQLGRQLCIIVFALTAALAGQDEGNGRRGVKPEDYFAFEFLSDPRISPDGKLVAYVVTTIDQKQNRRQTAIWLATVDGSRAPWLLAGASSSRSPRWLPDGRGIAFVSTRPVEGSNAGNSARPQVYVMSLSGGDPRRVTDLKNGVDSFQLSPDGARLACLSRSGPSDTVAAKTDVRHYTSITYKFNDTGWYDDKRAHVWVADVKTGAAKQITFGDEQNDADPQWSPDGKRIAYVSDRTDEAILRNSDLWVVAAEGGQPVRISEARAANSSPRWSPDGKRIAYIGAPTEADQPKIWLAPSEGNGRSVVASREVDLVPRDPKWTPDGRAITFGAGVKGEAHLFKIDLASQQLSQLTSGARLITVADLHEPAGLMVYVANDVKHPDDLYVADLTGRSERQLTHLNHALMNHLQVQDVERITYKSVDDWMVDGFLMKPVGWEAGKKYPMVLSIHGGPNGMYGVGWDQEFQGYAARGWAVFFTNPRGSSGYGEKFQRGVDKEWGGKAYQDIMNGVEAVLANHSWIDRERLGVTGGSYGGFMTNWIVTQTNIFKAAVTLRSISNLISVQGTRDAAYGHARDYGGDLWENFDLYWRYSAIRYAKNVKTPTLVMHSDSDHRTPLSQGEEWFRALKHFGVTTEFVIFPRENHNLTRSGEPKHLVESLQWQIYWFDRFLNGNEKAVRPNGK